MRLRAHASPAPLVGSLAVPGDKSITHRALILAGLAHGRSRITGANVGGDVVATATALSALGASCTFDKANSLVDVDGSGHGGLREPDGVIDTGNSGTSLRLLLGVCAGMEGLTVLTGDDSLRRRPMLRVVAPLRQMGATIDGRRHGDRAPLSVRGSELTGIDIDLPVASAQVKTALLLAGLVAHGRTEVTEPAPSRDHTERMLAAAGVAVQRRGLTVTVEGGAELNARDVEVPGDLSSAMFLIVAAALISGSDLELTGVGLNPTRTGGLAALQQMGVAIETEITAEGGGEPRGHIRVRSAELSGTRITPEQVPGLVDEIPALVLAATQAHGTTEFRGAGELRVKESDRIRALATALGALGADIKELPDGLVVRGPTRLVAGDVDSLGDHRIAMTLALAGIVSGTPVRVEGWSSVSTSFPEFLDLLGRAQGRL